MFRRNSASLRRAGSFKDCVQSSGEDNPLKMNMWKNEEEEEEEEVEVMWWWWWEYNSKLHHKEDNYDNGRWTKWLKITPSGGFWYRWGLKDERHCLLECYTTYSCKHFPTCTYMYQKKDAAVLSAKRWYISKRLHGVTLQQTLFADNAVSTINTAI
jgi:AAA15 family ATPase/GTPase